MCTNLRYQAGKTLKTNQISLEMISNYWFGIGRLPKTRALHQIIGNRWRKVQETIRQSCHSSFSFLHFQRSDLLVISVFDLKNLTFITSILTKDFWPYKFLTNFIFQVKFVQFIIKKQPKRSDLLVISISWIGQAVFDLTTENISPKKQKFVRNSNFSSY